MGFRGEEFAFGSPEEAVRGMIACLGGRSLPTEECGLAHSVGRVLGESVIADRDSPAFDYSAMDGFVVRAAVARAGARLVVEGECRVGREAPMVSERGALRIATGAPVPSGEVAVVRREDVEELGEEVVIGSAVRVGAGDNIRRRGENCRTGDMVLTPGRMITPAAVGTLAAVGRSSARVYRKVRVAVITTGDELAPGGGSLGAFEVRNSNGPALRAAVGSYAWAEPGGACHVKDEPGSLREAIREALRASDAVVLTGGVSMGHRDFVREAAEGAGCEVVFHGLPQRPGKPLLGAVWGGDDGVKKALFGLPGNPVSAMVTFVRVVTPVLGVVAGIAAWPGPARVRLENDDGRRIGLWWHRPVRLVRAGEAELVETKGSGDVISAGATDGFVELAPEGAGGGPGGMVDFYPWPA